MAPRETVKRVLRTEGEALFAMASSPPEGFEKAVELILSLKGRVIVSGMGKSGHIARKIAATLASTGTPAFFIHPGEASHGDLGMLTKDDLCLLLSNSGETSELGDLIAYCTRFGIPVLGMTKVATSSLAQAAEVPLIVPDSPEACAIGIAPTTSTTMMLALGDALAVALMEERGFRHEEFRTFHPGGKLGAQLTRLHQVMHTGEALPLVPETASMEETILIMTSRSFGVAGVVKADGRLAGVISDGDLRRNLVGLFERKAMDVATQSPITAEPEMLASEVLAVMNRHQISSIFVLEEERPIGIVHLHDLLRIGVT